MLGTASATLCLMIVLYILHLPLWLLNMAIFSFGLGSSGFLVSYSMAKSTNSCVIVLGRSLGF